MYLKTEGPPDGFYPLEEEIPSPTILESPLKDLADILHPLSELIDKSEPLEQCDNLQAVCGLSLSKRKLLWVALEKTLSYFFLPRFALHIEKKAKMSAKNQASKVILQASKFKISYSAALLFLQLDYYWFLDKR